MKRIIALLTIILFSQIAHSQSLNEYDILWKKVESFELDDLPKSALEQVNIISKKAKKARNSPQTVKALLYTSKFALTLEEDAQLKIITDFKTEIATAEFPTKNVLESYLANLYWQYFQQNRYRFYNRTKTDAKVDTTDFRTWDLTTLFNEINSHFEASLIDGKKLQQIKIAEFEILLNKRADSEKYRPTLFDIIAHNALAFYKTPENNITRPADKFEINDPEYLCEAYQFTQKTIHTTDQTSKQAKALTIYQQLLDFHLKDSSFDAYVEVDIERLKYIRDNATFSKKNEQLLEVLTNTAEGLKQNKYAALYNYELALVYQKWGQTYKAKTNEEYRWKLKEALELCEFVIEEHPKTRAAEKCIALKAQLLKTELQITTEENIPTNTVSRLLVHYKNQDSLQFSALKVNRSKLKTFNKLYKKEEKLKFLKKLTVTKTWKTALKNEGDYQSHGTEISMPALANGTYIIFTETTDTQNTFAYSTLQVTNIALTEIQEQNSQIYQVVNRSSGKPLAGAQLKISYSKNYNRARHSILKTTDHLGRVTLEKKSGRSWSNIQIEISYLNDKAYFGNYYIRNRREPQKEEVKSKAFVFSDRSIYRPGQTIYFKGILVETFKNKSSLMTKELVFATLYDANDQEISELEFETNDYGSFSGEFILPSNGLTGQYHIEIDADSSLIYDEHYFSVEEYKRPKFETSFKPITETYKVNDSIAIKGTAMAYAGSNISDAKVSYRVKRIVQYPRWYYWYRPYFNSKAQEITHGETTTDASGVYTINFKAVPDASVDAKNLPVFKYEVTADVTDINGETHSANTIVSVGYHAVIASIEIAANIDKDAKENSLTISSTNLNGESVDTKGILKMYKLKSPENTIRPRSWPAPDYAGFSKTAFKKLYPHDAYTNEHDYLQWEKGELVWQTDFDTATSKEISLGKTKKWRSGRYIIELETKDKFNQVVKDIAHTNLTSEKDKQLADKQLFEIKTDKQQYNIGDQTTISLATAADNLNVMVYIEKQNKTIDSRLVQLNKDTKSFKIPVTASDLGGFSITYSFTVYNSFHTGKVTINVPYPKTDLEITTSTFRDKLQPGTDEIWAFKVKGAKGEKVATELLANMYDASLDSFKSHAWYFNPLVKPSYYSQVNCNGSNSFGTSNFTIQSEFAHTSLINDYSYDSFDWFGLSIGNNNNIRIRGVSSIYGNRATDSELNEVIVTSKGLKREKKALGYAVSSVQSEDLENDSVNKALSGRVVGVEITKASPEENTQKADFSKVKIRKNLQETAFFFPQLKTDKEGNVSFSFTTPEALTKWNVQLLAHTKNLESSILNLQTVTQKELMVIPNAPRFLREGDEITISSKISNLTDKALLGQAQLKLKDAISGKDISKKIFINSPPSGELEGAFKVDSMGNTQVSWRLKIPENIQAVQYTVTAKAGDFSDGEQNVLPVLSNRMLVTETLPMWVRSNQTKTFTLDKLKNAPTGTEQGRSTLKHHKLTLEITSNPAWYAVQALPYLMEYPYDCNEQTFSKYYANTLASHIANSNHKIQEVFTQWANSDALVSNLEKNQELKSLLIQETPWLRDAQSETEQKKRIALLFNLNKMKNEQANALNKLKQNQKSSGGWPWFKGGRENRYITQHIITGLGHLKHLSVTSSSVEMQKVIKKAIKYLDNEFIKEYYQMKKYAKDLNDDHLSNTQIHYLYMRSFFKDIKTSKQVDEITAYYKGQTQKYWKNKSLYSQGMLALITYRSDDKKTAEKILRGLEENSITSEELGMYWKKNTNSWHWYQAPIETQALLIEAFAEIHPKDVETIDNLKIWLLKNKQTSQWKTTKATTEAVYALLLQGSDWLSVTDAVDVLVGGEKINPSKLENVKVEAGTGYYKTAWNGTEVQPKMAEVQISKKGDGIAWGAMYWQYFEDLDKITTAETPLKLKKKLFLKKNTDTGEEISEITAKTDLKVGDLVKVRIELRADRPMEFVHMKDMRAAGFEPVNVISRYKWQDGLGYYQATKDASTNFFFDYLPKGVYVFEYDVRVNNAGDFSNGITTIQSMYAPEFSSHSEGVRVKVN